MALRVNGKDIKDAIIKTDQFEMRILELTPDHLKVIVKETSGHPFNFVPRFFEMIYPERSIAAKDAGIVTVGTGKVVEAVVESFDAKLLENFINSVIDFARALSNYIWND